MARAKLIVLNGFAAAGKTTIAKMYTAEHSLALALEADAIVDNIGGWTNHNEEVRQLTFELTKAILQTYLPSGHDVVLPYLVTNAEEVQEFESIATVAMPIITNLSCTTNELMPYSDCSNAEDGARRPLRHSPAKICPKLKGC